MKKNLLLNLALGVSFLASAQNSTYAPLKINSVQKNKAYVVPTVMDEPLPFSTVYTNPTTSSRNSNSVHVSTFTSVSVTNTGYQSQTNSSTRNAIVQNSDGTISIANTFSNLTDNAWADRGTGYNYFNGTSWQATPSTRIENIRTGWSNIAVTGSGKEHIIAHNPANSQTVYCSRPVKGTGAWTQTNNAILSPSIGNLWPRLAAGGSNYLHAISITSPTGTTYGGQPYLGQNGALCYARSTDDGVTWSSWTANPLHDSLSGVYKFKGDNYSLDAKGNTVAYAFCGFDLSAVLMKSNDAGVTWTKTIIKAFPIPDWNGQITDTNNDAIADTCWATDGSMDIVIDNNNLVHVFMGRMRVLNTTANAASISFFPVTDGMYYWNENMTPGHPSVITGCIDYNNNGTIDLPAPSGTDFPFGAYYSSMVSHPTCGVDANNKLFLVYDGIVEGTDDGNSKAWRAIYGMISTNSGTSWSNPIMIDSNLLEEHVYPNMPSHFTGTCVPLTYMSDGAVGNGLTTQPSGTPDPNNLYADIMYGCLPVLDFYAGVHERTNDLFNVSDNYPNPFHGSTSIAITMNKSSKVSLDIYSTLGQKVAETITSDLSSGKNTLDIDGTKLSAGIYFYTVRAGEFTVTKKMIVE